MSITTQSTETTVNPASFDYFRAINLAIEKGLPDVAKALNDSRMQEIAQAARMAFYKDLATFQANNKSVHKSKTVVRGEGKGSYKYAPLDIIMEQCQPILTELGFSITTCSRVNDEGTLLTVSAVLHHKGGHKSEPSEFTVPIDKAARMNSIQQFGAARSYALRYAITNLLGITTCDEDTDANTNSGRPASANRQHEPANRPVETNRPTNVQSVNPPRANPANTTSTGHGKLIERIGTLPDGEDFEARMKKAIDGVREKFGDTVPSDVTDAINNRIIAQINAIPSDDKLFGATRGAKKTAHNLFGDSLPDAINAALKVRFQEWDAMSKKQPSAA
jgi:hypothetical protein